MYSASIFKVLHPRTTVNGDPKFIRHICASDLPMDSTRPTFGSFASKGKHSKRFQKKCYPNSWKKMISKFNGSTRAFIWGKRLQEEDKIDFFAFFFVNFFLALVALFNFIFGSLGFLICIVRICLTLFLSPNKPRREKWSLHWTLY